MIIALDTDVLVHWAVVETAHHDAVRRWVRRVCEEGVVLGVSTQVACELLHVVTDSRRFEEPLAMNTAVSFVERLIESREVTTLSSSSDTLPHLCELLRQFGVGRKRILDTALVSTLAKAGVSRLATFNQRHYTGFRSIELVDPRLG